MTLGSSNPSLKADKKVEKINTIIKVEQVPKTTIVVAKQQPQGNSFKYLGGFYLLTSLVHFGILAAVAMTTFEYPITIFETRLRPDVSSGFNCVYDYGKTGSGEYFCNSDSHTETGNRSIPAPECVIPLRAYSLNIGFDSTKGPWIQSYQLNEVISGDNGAMLAKGILIFVQAVTASSDLLKFINFMRVRTICDHLSIVKECSLPLQWREYALTTSMLSFFIASMAQTFDLMFLVSSVLSQYALMFLGYAIDIFASAGNTDVALILFWQPGMALFAIAWWPVFYSIINLKSVLCKSGGSFTCEPTCFEHDYQFQIFSLVSFISFSLFPLVTLYKLYVISKAYKRLLGSYAKYRFLNFLVFVAYIPTSFLMSIFYSISETISFSRSRKPDTGYVSYTRRHNLFLTTQYMYSVLSLFSKSFITLFFLYMFATDFPWSDIQRQIT